MNIISHVKRAPSLSSPATRLCLSGLFGGSELILILDLFHVSFGFGGCGGFPVCPGMHRRGRQKLFDSLLIQFSRYSQRLRQCDSFTVNITVEQVTGSGPFMRRVARGSQS